jgi:gliding motility-associated-like protein
MYGNKEYFELTIYNRWGQQVFRSEDPKEYWDGSFGGRPCDMGTFFFTVRSKCMTSGLENHKGEFILIR